MARLWFKKGNIMIWNHISSAWVIAALLALNPADLRAEEPDLSQNAALQYLRAMSAMREISRDDVVSLEILKHPVDAELNDAATSLIKRNGFALHHVKQGAKVKRCDWETPNDGWDTLLNHTQRSRDLAHLMILRARYRFDRARDEAAVSDLCDTLVFARHVAADPYIIPMLVQIHFEEKAIRVLARHLPALQPETLRGLAQRLEKLPKSASLSQRWRREKKLYLEYLERIVDGPTEEPLPDENAKTAMERVAEQLRGSSRNPQRVAWASEATAQGEQHLRELMRTTETPWDESVELLQLSPKEFPAAYAAFQKPLADENPLAKLWLSQSEKGFPQLAKYHLTEAQGRLRLHMLKTAIEVLEEGPDALQYAKFKDPYGDGPLEMRYSEADEEGEFELRSQLLVDGKPFTMVFGE